MSSEDTESDDDETLVSRRDWLSVTGAAVGTALVGTSATGSASAQTGNEPRINLGDNFYIDDVDGDTLAIKDASDGSTILEYDATVGEWSVASVDIGTLASALDAAGNDITNVGSFSSESVSAESIGTERHYAGAFSGADADARLDSALSKASDGDTIYLEKSEYAADRTLSQQIVFVGPSTMATSVAIISGSWTANNPMTLKHMRIDGSVEMAGNDSMISHCRGVNSTITVSTTRCAVVSSDSVDVTFQSGTTNGLADSLFAGSSVTDNGSNTVGDIA